MDPEKIKKLADEVAKIQLDIANFTEDLRLSRIDLAAKQRELTAAVRVRKSRNGEPGKV